MLLRSNNLVGSGQPPDPIASPGEGVATAPGNTSSSRQGNAVLSDDPHGSRGTMIDDGNGLESVDIPHTNAEDCFIDVDDNVNTSTSYLNNQDTTINKCNGRGCHTCPRLSLNKHFTSTVTGRVYNMANFDLDQFDVDCKATNLMYLLTCLTEQCGLQYTGETVQKYFSSRMSVHIRCTDSNSNETGMRYVKAHFTSGLCCGASFKINIIEKLPGNGRDENGAIDPEVTAERRQRERWWMHELRTIYPYGLNIRDGFEDHTHENKDLISYKKFNRLPNNRPKKRGKYKCKKDIKKINNDIDINNIVKYLKSLTQEYVPITIRKGRACIFGLPKCVISQISEKFEQELNNIATGNIQQFDVICDLLKFRKNCKPINTPTVKKKNSKASFMCINFVNKGIEMINLPKILHLREIKRSLPFRSNKDCDDRVPIISYSYPPSIRSKILNYKATLNEFKLDDEESNDMFPPCDCEESPFKDPYHGHVITGDLSIIKNDRLKKLISKGCNYRENININWKKAEKEIFTALDSVIEKMSKKDHIATVMFNEFKIKFKEKVQQEISLQKRRNTNTNFVPVLKDQGAKAELDRIHNAYVLTNVDKASKNVGIICKRF